MSYTAGLRTVAVGALAVSALAGLTGATAAADLNATEKKLVAAAKAEGEVLLLHPLFADRTGQLMGEAFVKRYDLGPNFKFHHVRKGTGQVVAQARQEIVAGKITADVVLVSAPAFYDEAAKRGAFEALDSTNWKDSEELAKKSGQYFSYPHVVTPLAYTFQPVWNTACPGMEKFDATSYADVVKPELKGKTFASDVTKSVTYANTVLSLRENKALDLEKLWKDLKATDPIIEFRTEPKMQAVVDCSRPLDMWNLSGRVYQNVLKKPELAKTLKVGYYKEGQVILGNQAAVMKGAPHPNAGKLLMEFLLGQEGSDIFVEGEGVLSFRKGYKPPAAAAPYVLDLEKHKLLGLKDWIAAGKEMKAMRDDWQKVFQ